MCSTQNLVLSEHGHHEWACGDEKTRKKRWGTRVLVPGHKNSGARHVPDCQSAKAWLITQINENLLFLFHFTGLVISGGDFSGTSIETFPADDLSCNIPSFPEPGNPLIILFSFQGRLSHSLSVVDNGQQLVACGGFYSSTRTSCISWRSGHDEWTQYATLRW